MAGRDTDPNLVERYARLISLAVHELRTPASVVGGYLRMLQRDADGLSERQKKMVEEASRSCDRLIELIAELSEVGKLDDGRAALHREPFDLFALIQDVIPGIQEGSDRGITCIARGPASGAPMVGDRARFRSSFESLCRAVLREQPDSAVVVVDRQTRLNDKAAALIVIAREDDIERTRSTAASAFDEKRSGVGLGLPIARRVIERHGGRIWSPASESGDPAARSGIVVSIPIAD